MQNIFIDVLPPWVETGLQPAFYDLESGTVLQQTARMYAKVRELTEAFNTFTVNVTNEINTFEQNTNDEIERFEGVINDTVEEYIEKFNNLHDYVEDYFENLDVQQEINNKLDDMAEDGTLGTLISGYVDEYVAETNEKLETLPVEDKSKVILYAFFDIDDSNKINFFTSKDGVNINKLNVNTETTGVDPSVLYKNGKFYVAYTNQSTTYDFSIKVSEDLNTWEQHDINAGLYDATYTKRWAPEWFEDDNGKIYIIISKQYANTEGWGDFYQYIIECTDLETLTFGTARRMYLNNSPANNHIDGTIAKYNGVYHLIVKSEHQTELYLEHFTSSNLIDWDYQSADPMNFGRGVEAPDVFKLGDYYYIVADKYKNRPVLKTYQCICKTKDFQSYSDVDYINYPEISLNHGGGCVVEQKVINKLLTDGNVKEERSNNKLALIRCIKDFDIVANQLTDDDTNTGNPLGNFVHVFDVVDGSNWRTQHIQFFIASGITQKVSASYDMTIVTENNNITDFKINEMYSGVVNSQQSQSLAGKLFGIKDESNNKLIHVYIDLTVAQFATNEPILIKYLGNEYFHGKIIKFTDKFEDSVSTSTLTRYANGSANSRTCIVDYGTKTKARIVFSSRNGSIDVFGNINGTTTDKILCGKILVNGGNIAYLNLNSTLASAGTAITVKKESYDSSKLRYTILVENLPNYGSFGVTVPPSDMSYIVRADAVNS
jgi:predicted GH43/DUF377 family glycosyl hydrolase